MIQGDKNEGIFLRNALIELRDDALKNHDFKASIVLSHVIKWMYGVLELKGGEVAEPLTLKELDE